MGDAPQAPLLARLWARWWYAWGLSLCYSANSAASNGLYRWAERSFARAVQLWPAYAGAHYQLGLIRGRELGEYRAAVRDLERASAILPEWAEPYLQRGLLHRFNGQPAAAAAELQHYLALAPAGAWRDEAERQAAALARELGDQPGCVL